MNPASLKIKGRAPLMCPIEVNQTCEKGRTGSWGESDWRPDPVKCKNPVGDTNWKF